MADNDQKEENRDEPVVVGPVPRNFAVPGNDLTGYLGTADEYMNYADPSHKPYLTETEAYLYTNLDDEDIQATRDRRSYPEGYEVPKNEMPAIAEDTWDEAAVTNYGGVQNTYTVDPVAGPQHPAILSDEQEKALQEANKNPDDGSSKDATVSSAQSSNQAAQPSQPAGTKSAGAPAKSTSSAKSDRPNLSSK